MKLEGFKKKKKMNAKSAGKKHMRQREKHVRQRQVKQIFIQTVDKFCKHKDCKIV